ncbi:unnamed protein product [Closterium sp. NIES-53]
MASLRVLAFDHEGRPVQFDTWLDDLQLYLLNDSKDSVSLFDLASGAATAPPATADSSTRSQWLTRDAAARLAMRNHLPLAECAHFGQHRTAQALYDAVVARYSSPATAALGHLFLPYLFPELSAFATVEDLVSHLRASDARYRAAVPAEFLDRNPPLLYITLYFIVTRLLDSLRSVRDHFLSLDPTSLTVDLLEQHLLTAETSAVAVGAARGTPRPPFFEGCSPSPLAPSYASAAAADVSVPEDVRAASTSAKCRSSKGKGGRGGGGGSGGGGGGSGSGGGGSSGGSGGGGTVGGSGGSGGGGGGSGGSGGSGGGETGGGGSGARRSRIAIFDLDFDAILSTMYALFVSAEGDCYRCVPPDPGIAVAALGASEFGTLHGTAPAEALHTFTLESSASRCFFRDSTTLTPLPAPVPVKLADPSGGPVVARSSTVFPWSSMYKLATEPSLVAASAQVSASGQVAASCSCRLLTHQTLLWHHRLGHPSLPRLRGMHSRLLVSGLPRSLPPLPLSPAPPCLPCVEGRQRAAPHSSSFPPTTAPLQTLHMDVWGPARVNGQSRERYFLLVVDDYTRYTTVFPLRSKVQVVDVLIPWIRTVRLQLRERFGQDQPVLRLHSDRGGEFSSGFLREFCRGEGILQSFTFLDSPQQNGIAERRIGLVMEVARTSMIHTAAPLFLWLFAVRYAAHQLNLWPRVSLPETSPTLRWTGEVGDASVFLVRGSRTFVRDTSADKLSPRAIPCVFHGFVPDAPGWQFYHPTSRRVLPSQDVTFDESVPFYRLFPYRSAPPLPPPLFLAPGPPPVDPLPPQDPAPSGVSQVDPLRGTAPVQIAIGSGAARGAASGGAASGGTEPGGAESEGTETGGAEPGGVGTGGGEPGGADPEGVEPGGAGVAAGTGVTGGTAATGPGGARTRGTGAAGTGGVEGAGAGDPTGPGAAGAGGAGAGGAGVGGLGVGGAGAAGAGVGGTGAAGAGAVDPGAGGAGGTVRPRPYFVPLLQQILGTPSSTGLTPPLLCPPRDQSQPSLQPASPLPPPSPYTEQSGGLTECCEPASRPVLPVHTARRAPRSCPPSVPGTHAMALRPSSVPLRVPLPTPLESSLPESPDPESDRTRAASPAVSLLFATAVTDPSFEFAAASALDAELLDFAAACRLDYATALVAESVSTSPPSVGGECALCTDVLEDRKEDFECLAAAVPRFASMLLAPEGDPDAPDIPTPRSYAETITGPYSSQVKRPSGSPSAFKARYVARGFSQRQGVDYFQTFSPTPKMTTLRVLLHVAAQRDYALHSLDFSTAFLLGSLHEEILLRRPPRFTESFPAGTQWSLRRPVYGLRQAPREWHATVRTTLAALGFAPSTADLSLSFSASASISPRHCPLLCLLATCSQLHLQTSPVQLLHADASWVDNSATQRSSQGYTFSLGSGSVSWRSTRSSSVLSSRCEADIYAGAMAAQELRWLTYLLTDLGEQPRSPPILYVDNKAMIALCQEHRLEHRTKHIALQYFLARELQQRGQLRLAYVATRANTTDVFTKALPPGDHQHSTSVLGLLALLFLTGPALALPQPCTCTCPGLAPPPAPGPAPDLPRPCLGPAPALPRLCFLPWLCPGSAPALLRPCPGPAPALHLHLPRPCPGSPPALPLPCPGPAPASPLPAAAPVMTSLNVLTFDAEGRAVDFEVWLDDLQLFLQCDSKDGLSLFDLTSGASTAPAADADSTVHSQWLTRDAAARLAVRNHLPSTERAHFSQYKSARALYDAVVARYSSPSTAALSRLMLPYLFPDLAAFATVADLVAHLRTSDTRYRAALPTEFCAKNPPPCTSPFTT